MQERGAACHEALRTDYLAALEWIPSPKPRRDENELHEAARPEAHGRSASASDRWQLDASPSTERPPSFKSALPSRTASPPSASPSRNPSADIGNKKGKRGLQALRATEPAKPANAPSEAEQRSEPDRADVPLVEAEGTVARSTAPVAEPPMPPPPRLCRGSNLRRGLRHRPMSRRSPMETIRPTRNGLARKRRLLRNWPGRNRCRSRMRPPSRRSPP
ncbi:hypothetical protein LX81_02592 [Palleronia aestuarii]|uniref:Uncharacterized protein n=1 Tax=Palleronia aestuarii TaxID=568105 RepID=A0A2W7Q0H8_9RHOB|nr:hypothetical protein LX81_02592 [Palleronia aestuarii]